MRREDVTRHTEENGAKISTDFESASKKPSSDSSHGRYRTAIFDPRPPVQKRVTPSYGQSSRGGFSSVIAPWWRFKRACLSAFGFRAPFAAKVRKCESDIFQLPTIDTVKASKRTFFQYFRSRTPN
eukprot:scaffold942_cov260-Pinguiococcus_pyrenoidosus.AAC.9